MQELVSSETLNNEEEIIVFEENLKGPKGENGATFTPNVSKTGNLSWTNDKNLENPETVNIRGPQGLQGIQGPQGLQGDKGEKGDDGYTPVKGTDYFTEADKQEFIEAVTEDASSNFVQTVSEKTTEFNNNATSKTNAFNSNVESKTTEFNNNATTKLNEYNENHTSKLTAYNDNATAKIAEYDEHIEDLDNIVSKNIVSGESVSIDDALAYKVFGAKIDGNKKQTTTTGKQMLQMCPEVRETNGLTFTKNEDGSVVINGTSTATTYCNLNTSYSDTSDNKYFSLKQNSYYTVYLKNRTSDVNLAFRTSTINSAIVQLDANDINSGQYTNEDSSTAFAYLQISANKKFNNLVVYPMIAEGQFSELEWEEYTNGEVSPNPDYPQEIKTITNSVKIKQVGKNLIAKDNTTVQTSNGITRTINEDGSITFTGTSTGNPTFYISANSHILQGKYTFSIGKKHTFPCQIRLNNNSGGSSYHEIMSNDSSVTFDYHNNDFSDNKFRILVWFSASRCPVGTTVNFTIYPQLEVGDNETDYEEYKSNEYTIDLQDNELVKLSDDIKDTIEIDKSGNVSLNKRIGKAVLDENTNPTIASQNYQGLFFFSLSALNMNVNSLKAISDYFTFVDDVRITDNASANTYLSYGQFGFRHGTTDRIYFKIADITTGTDFKAWLAEHNVTVYYELAELTTTSLGQLANFKTYAGINHFFLEANLATNFEIRYAQDLQKVISKQQSEIDELKTLLSSTATSAMLLDNYANDLVEEV